MNNYNLSIIAAILFSVSLYGVLLGVRKEAKQTGLSYFVPAVLLVLSFNLIHQYSSYTMIKVAFTAHFLLLSIHYLIPAENTRIIIGFFLSVAITGLIFSGYSLPIFYIGLALLLSALFHLFAASTMYRKNRQSDLLENAIIGIIGSGIMVASNSLYTLISGCGILIIYQLSTIIFLVKKEKNRQAQIKERLYDLENRFSRQVENEAKRRTNQMATQVEQIREKSQKDPLTKALNRTGLNAEINLLISDSSVKMFSVAIIDIDYFKEINDSLGHLEGDNCLKYLAEYIHSKNRRSDILGRFGGDEFVLVMPNINAPEAIKTADRIRKNIAQLSKPHFTLSVGVATYPYDGKNVEDLLETADQSLYQSKEKGRNTVSYVGHVPLFNKRPLT